VSDIELNVIPLDTLELYGHAVKLTIIVRPDLNTSDPTVDARARSDTRWVGGTEGTVGKRPATVSIANYGYCDMGVVDEAQGWKDDESFFAASVTWLETLGEQAEANKLRMAGFSGGNQPAAERLWQSIQRGTNVSYSKP